ncbi:MAG: alternative ribosome rescue aminoacyl-tRNA hydrolase ArfB [Deltaproteobacteria bacterium]|nr:alternative ribosome rescue aminoacyl-tRNA hydrolase ArfB [Deltaproteobacteria bacterium]
MPLEKVRFIIPPREVEYRTARAGGPGGQHVNKTETKVEARWNLRASGALDDSARAKLLRVLAKRLDAEGALRAVARRSRSQSANKVEALVRLQAAVDAALVPRKKRRATKPGAGARERRIKKKKQRGEIKRMRRPMRDD